MVNVISCPGPSPENRGAPALNRPCRRIDKGQTTSPDLTSENVVPRRGFPPRLDHRYCHIKNSLSTGNLTSLDAADHFLLLALNFEKKKVSLHGRRLGIDS